MQRLTSRIGGEALLTPLHGTVHQTHPGPRPVVVAFNRLRSNRLTGCRNRDIMA